MIYKKALLVLSLIGLALSLYLTYHYHKPEPIVCLGDYTACDTVRLSSYSSVFGVKLPILGDIFFFGLALYIGFAKFFEGLIGKEVYKSILLLSLLGAMLFELYLTYLQIFVINSVCFWCISIGLTVFSIGVVYLLSFTSFALKNNYVE